MRWMEVEALDSKEIIYIITAAQPAYLRGGGHIINYFIICWLSCSDLKLHQVQFKIVTCVLQNMARRIKLFSPSYTTNSSNSYKDKAPAIYFLPAQLGLLFKGKKC